MLISDFRFSIDDLPFYAVSRLHELLAAQSKQLAPFKGGTKLNEKAGRTKEENQVLDFRTTFTTNRKAS
jgi:hypothetical protein